MNQIRPVWSEKILSNFFLQIGQFPIIFCIAVYGMNDDFTVEHFRIDNILKQYFCMDSPCLYHHVVSIIPISALIPAPDFQQRISKDLIEFIIR